MHKAHKLAMEAIDLLMDTEAETPECALLSDLAEAVEKYECAVLEWDTVNGPFGVGA